MIFSNEPEKDNYYHCHQASFIETAEPCGMIAKKVNGDRNDRSQSQIGGVQDIVEQAEMIRLHVGSQTDSDSKKEKH